MLTVRLVFVLLALVFAPALTLAQDRFVGKIVAIDAPDRYSVRLDSWTVRVKLHGVRIAESGVQSTVARKYVERRVPPGTRVSVAVRGTASQGVVWGDVTPVGATISLNRELVRGGIAAWERRFAPRRADLSADEIDAKRARAGFWGSLDGGNIVLPAELKEKTKESASPPPKPAPASPTSVSPMPTATPAARTPTPAPKPTPVPASSPLNLSPLTLSLLLLSVAALAGAGGLLGPGIRLATPRRALVDAAPGPIRIDGAARPTETPITPKLLRLPCVWVHTRVERNRVGRWTTERDDTEAVAFVLDDGTASIAIDPNSLHGNPIRIVRFYNDVPVEDWYARAYPDDIRTEIRYIPAGAVVTAIGSLLPDNQTLAPPVRAKSVWLIEGDPKRLARTKTRAALFLIVVTLPLLAYALLTL